MYSLVIFTVKLAILLQIQHIFSISSMPRFYLVQFMIWSNACWCFAYTFFIVFICTPVVKAWDFELPGHCANSTLGAALSTGGGFVSDLGILTLPIIWVWKVRMDRRRKLGVSLIFAMGFL